ncbi:MAG: dephospho-CoA kinase [Gemmataceae bacterium]
MKPLVVGLLGGIGAGKSAVAQAFARHGACMVNADALGHEALEQPAIREAILRRWGPTVADATGRINRHQLAAEVFRNETARRELEALVHPYIRRRAEEEIARATAEHVPLIVVDAAVLLEAGWNHVCDRLVYVDAPAEVRLERVRRNRNWSEQDWRAREEAQLPLTQKRAQADHVLDNASTPEHLSRQVEDLMHRWGLVPARDLIQPKSPSSP